MQPNLKPKTLPRITWAALAHKIAHPVLSHFSAGTLRTHMPVEVTAESQDPNTLRADRSRFAHLEAVGRTLIGLAPWFEAQDLEPDEATLRDELRSLALQGLTRAAQPNAPDALPFHIQGQPLVDAAFLANAFLHAPTQLWGQLSPATQAAYLSGFRQTRQTKPAFSNWLLFSAIIEAFFHKIGAEADPMRIDYALNQHLQWYKGDGAYGDGPDFHWDYYNSFVIQPMLLDTLEAVKGWHNWHDIINKALPRAQRYAVVLERLISPEGAIPPLGRSLPYRFGCLQALGHLALKHALPPSLPPAQARAGMAAAIFRLAEAPGTFDSQGWLSIGFCGHQPSLAEPYICTGSLYLCTAAFLPLGLPPSDPFWADPWQPWTSLRLYQGLPIPRDYALYG